MENSWRNYKFAILGSPQEIKWTNLISYFQLKMTLLIPNHSNSWQMFTPAPGRRPGAPGRGRQGVVYFVETHDGENQKYGGSQPTPTIVLEIVIHELLNEIHLQETSIMYMPLSSF